MKKENNYAIIEYLNDNRTVLEFESLEKAELEFDYMVEKYLIDSNNQLGFNFKTCKNWSIDLTHGNGEDIFHNTMKSINLLELRKKIIRLKELLEKNDESDEIADIFDNFSTEEYEYYRSITR